MAKQLTYDPMSAVGLRLGMPGGHDYLEGEAENIADIHGEKFLSDLRDAAYRSDMDAALRVAAAITPGATYEIGSEDGYTTVRYAVGEFDGSMKTRDDDPCTALVSAAASIRCEYRVRGLSFEAPGEPENDAGQLPAPR